MKLRAAHYRTGEVSEFTFGGAKLAERRTVRGRASLVYGPGFFDLQCNGYAGIDFNSPRLTPEQARFAISAMWQHGCTHVLPTVVTHQPERLEFLFRTLALAIEDREIASSVPGFHLEGPFISPVDGARGAHPLHAVRPVETTLWQRLQRASGKRIAVVTLAPEVKGGVRFIGRLRSEEVLPAIGHTMASTEQVHAAADAGALLSTHLGNGCPQLLPRHENPIFAQLACDGLTASLIPDGIHLPGDVLKVMCRAKGLERIVAVTDAMSAAGAPPGRYPLADMEMEVGTDRVVRQPGSPNFAGSALTMDRAISILVEKGGLSLADAWDAGSGQAWSVMRRAGGRVAASRPKSLVMADFQDGTLRICATLSGNKVLWMSRAADGS